MPVQPKVERIRDAAHAVLERLERGDRLSDVLPQAKAVVDDYGSRIHAFWLQSEMYGALDVPLKTYPLEDKDARSGYRLFGVLHKVAESRHLTFDDVQRQLNEEGLPKRDTVACQSIAEIERSVETWPRMQGLIDAGLVEPELALRQGVSKDERERVLWRVRNYLYEYMSRIHGWALAECENQALLGVDYRIVIDTLDALKSSVGQELAGALEALRSPNPALWAGSALICRNVILALGRSLWQAKGDSYHSGLAGRALDMKGEKEVNRLRAFIDYHHSRAKDEKTKARLVELDALVPSIYKQGSKGKRRVRHEEAQKLVIDTFELVADLDRLTGLRPVGDSV